MEKQDIDQVKATDEKAESPKKGNVTACLGYCPVLFVVPYLIHAESEEEDKMNRLCGQQGLWLLLAFIVLNMLRTVFSYIYMPGLQGPVNIAITVINIILLVTTVIGMMRAYNGKVLCLPVVGKIDLIKKAMGN